MRLADKVAIVTGGAQGIGREYSLRFAQEGAAVTIGDIRAEEAKQVESEIIAALCTRCSTWWPWASCWSIISRSSFTRWLSLTSVRRRAGCRCG